MITHIQIDGGTLCRTASVRAMVTSADCARCVRRLDQLIEVAILAAGGRDAAPLARKVLDNLGYKRETINEIANR